LSPIWTYFAKLAAPSRKSQCLSCPQLLAGWNPHHAERHLESKHFDQYELYLVDRSQWLKSKQKYQDLWMQKFYNPDNQ